MEERAIIMYPIPEKNGAMLPNNLTGPDFTVYILEQ